MKLSNNLNNSISQISHIMRTCDINNIGNTCLKLAKKSTILPIKSYLTPGEQAEIEFIMDTMSKEPLDDRLSLNPKIFAAVQSYVERRILIKNLETNH